MSTVEKKKSIVDYFFVCGIDLSVGLESFPAGDSQNDNYLGQPPLGRPYKSRIIQHFPEHSPNCPFDAESTALVTMPQGLNLYTQKSPKFFENLHPVRHTFTITREDGTRVHGLALLFLDEIIHKGVREAISSLQSMYEFELGASFSTKSSTNPSAPSVTCDSHYNKDQDAIFATKAIGLLSRHAFIYGLFGWLEDIWAAMYLSSPGLTYSNLELCIRDLLFSTKLPPPGKRLTFSSLFRTHYAYRPSPGCRFFSTLNKYLRFSNAIELPLFEYSILTLFNLISIDDFLRLFTCTLLEFRVILFSKVYYRLMLAAEVVTCMLLPFTWLHVYAPILPVSLFHFVDAPVPYIMGINFCNYCEHNLERTSNMDDYIKKRSDDSNPSNACSDNVHLMNRTRGTCSHGIIELASEAKVCYVYLDEGRVVVPDELPQFPNAQTVKESVLEILKGVDLLTEKLLLVPQPAPVLRPRPPSSLTNMPKSVQSLPTEASNSLLSNESRINSTSQPSGDSTFDSLNYAKSNPFVRLTTQIAKSIISTEPLREYARLLHINTVIRNIFLANFTSMFHDYEKFLVLDKKSLQTNRNEQEKINCSGLQFFDKVSFLSDQPETHLAFLSAFLETQMFTSFLDQRVNWSSYFENTSNAMKDVNEHVNGSKVPPINLVIFHRFLQYPEYKRSFLGPSPSEEMHITKFPNDCIFVPTQFPDYGPMLDVSSRSSVTYSNENQIEGTHLQESLLLPQPLPDLLTNASGLTSSNTVDIPILPTFHSHHVGCFPMLSNSLNISPEIEQENVVIPQLKSTNIRTTTTVSTSFKPFVSRFQYETGNCERRLNNPVNSAPVSPPIRSVLISGFMSTPIKRAPLLAKEMLKQECLSGNDIMNVDYKFTQVRKAVPERINRSFVQAHQLADLQRTGMAQANWDFVDTLLEECKYRTKRMVLKKIGQEAIDLGHIDPTVTIVEENTLVSGLCDLLERIWSHGLTRKIGKSALWSHLVLYSKLNTNAQGKQSLEHSSDFTTDLEQIELISSSSTSSSCTNSPLPIPLGHKLKTKFRPSGTQLSPETNGKQCALGAEFTNYTPLNCLGKNSQDVQKNNAQQILTNYAISGQDYMKSTHWRLRFPFSELRGFNRSHNFSSGENSHMPQSTMPNLFSAYSSTSAVGMVLDLRKIFGSQLLENSLITDINSVQAISSVKTDIGFARAFVRLALEKKLLSAHLTRLLIDTKLLRYLYERYAFLRCEEEREQFLIHLLSLNAVDYYSFTRMLTQAELIYQIFICNGRKHGLDTTANCWIKLNGHLGSTQVVNLPRGHNLIDIKNRNLGTLSTVQIGHDNHGSSPKWFIEFVIVRNAITNQLYLFPCYHWFGLGVEDDALERVLIGEQVRLAPGDPHLLFTAPPTESIDLVPNLPNRCLSPSVSRRGCMNAFLIHDRVANAINRLLKYFCKVNRHHVMSLTFLWCGEQGLIPSLNLVFNYGFRSSRLFQKRIYVWDYLEKVACGLARELNMIIPRQTELSTLEPKFTQINKRALTFSTYSLPRSINNRIRTELPPGRPRKIHQSPSFSIVSEALSTESANPNLPSFSQPNSPAMTRVHPTSFVDHLELLTSTILERPPLNDSSVDKTLFTMNIKQLAFSFTKTVHTIIETGSRLGKEGKLQRFICRALQDHLLVGWLSLLALSPITAQMYESKAFLLNHDLRQSVQQLLKSLDEFEFTMESALLGDNVS